MLKEGQVKFFSKSGNKVKLIKEHENGYWTVERVDGSSMGKQMYCPPESLVDQLEEIYD